MEVVRRGGSDGAVEWMCGMCRNSVMDESIPELVLYFSNIYM